MASSRHSDQPPAFVLGTGLTVLGVLRSLGRLGVPCVCLSKAPDFESRSRWYAPAPRLLAPWDTASDLAEALEQVPYRRGVLIPCSDHWTVEATRLTGSVAERFPACLPATGVVDALIDKARFQVELEEAEVPHPLTARIRDEAHLEELMGTAPSGAFLKPVDSQRFVAAFAKKAFNVATAADALECYGAARRAGIDLILQDYVPGPEHRHYFVDGFVDRNHRIAASFARRRLRMHPPDFGNSSCVVSIDAGLVVDAVESLQRLFQRTGYRGIFSAEFKLDERDDTFKLVEVNCRPWWYVEFAGRCGVNVVEMAYRDALGETTPAAGPYRVGAELVYTYFDLRACRRLLRERKMTPAACIRSWATSYKAIFSWDDPLPGMWNLGKRVRNWVRARLGGASWRSFD